MTLGEIFIKLGLKSEGFNQGIDQAKTKTSQFANLMSGIGAKIAGAFAIGAIVSFVKSAIQAYGEVAQANAKLAAVLKSTGGQAGMTALQLQGLSSELKNTTFFSGSTITNAEALMLTFTKVGRDVFPEAMKAATNMSAVFGTDLQGSVIQLGKALNSPISGMTALKRIGVSFTESQVEMIKRLQSTGDLLGAQRVILKELETEFGGAAEAAAKAGLGPLQMLGKQFSSLKKGIGATIVESELFKKSIQAIGQTLAGMKKSLDFSSKASSEEVGSGVQLFIDKLPKDTKLAKEAIQKQIKDIESENSDYENELTKLQTGAFNSLLNMNPLSSNSKRIRDLNELKDYNKKYLDELNIFNASLKEKQPKKQYTKDEQYAAAISELTQNIKEAEDAAVHADLGMPFVEASKAVADAKKELLDYIDTYDNKKSNKEAYDKESKELKNSVKDKEVILTDSFLKKEIIEETYQNRLSQLKIEGYTNELAIAEKYGQDTVDLQQKIIDEQLKIQKQGMEKLYPKQGGVFEIDPNTKQGKVQKPETLHYDTKMVGNLVSSEKQAQILENITQFNEDLNSLISSGMADAAETFGEGIGSLMSGDMNMQDFGKTLLVSIGKFLVDFGKLLIAYAFACDAFHKSIASGGLGWPLALAAGIAMVAAGTMITNSMKSQATSSTSPTSSSSSSSGSSSSSTTSATSNNKVVFEIKGTSLVGVLNNVDRKNNLIR